jgi:hypothetical protein
LAVGLGLVADAATLIAALIAALAAWTARETFRAQRQRNEVDHALAIIETLDRYKCDYYRCDADDEAFYLVQLLSYLELISYLLNEGLLAARVRFVIEAQIVEIWKTIDADDAKRALVAAVETDADKFAETRRFLKSAGALL